MIKAILLLFVAMPSTEYKHGTAIAAIVNSDELVIAADSRVVNSEDEPLEDICKIRIVNKTVFAAHGMSMHSETGFDLFALATNIISRAGSLKEATTEISRAGMKPFEAALMSIRSGQADTFVRKTGDIRAGVILARWEQHRPVLGYVRFVPEIKESRIVVHSETKFCPGSGCPAKKAAVFAGPVLAETQEFQLRHPNYTDGDIANTARRFVQEQIDRNRASVGPPIDIVQLRKGNVEWIQGKKSCFSEK